MNKNELINITIEDLGTDGEGIGKVNGFTLFVKDTIPGDEIEAKIIKLKKNFGYARLEKVIKPSPFRVIAPCNNSRRCGGCQIMDMSYERQLQFKENKVRNNLKRIGGISEELLNEIMEPIVGMEGEFPLRYRNKAQYPIGKDKDGNIIAGFYAGRTHSIISCTDCLLGVEENKEILDVIISYMKEKNVIPYDEETGKGLIRHVLIRKGFSTGEIMVCIVINGTQLPDSNYLCEKLQKIEGVKSISISVNREKTNVIMGDSFKTLWGNDTITDVMNVRIPSSSFKDCYGDGIKYNISPLSFYQVNPVQVEKLYGIGIEYADLSPEDEVWDLCCGIGTITLSMASQVSKVHGIEIVPQAIDDARQNAINNNISNAEFICAAVEEYLPAHKSEIKADVIVMDPPRKGMNEEALKVVVEAAPRKIVYISCDSATLARDVKFLSQNGYELRRVRAVDMFPHTNHVETVVLMSNVK